MQRYLMVLFIPLVALFSMPVFATTFSGKISVSKKFIEQLEEFRKETDKASLRGYWNEPNGIRPVGPVRFRLDSDIGVALFREGAPEPKADPVMSLNVLTGGLEKNVVLVRPKSRIKFFMSSPFDHELYASHKHDFKPQQQGNNSARPIDFYSAGIFEVKCKLFPHFQGWVVATPATYVLKVSKTGVFSLEDVEEGKYTIKVFFRGKWILEKKLEITGKKQDVALELKDASGNATESNSKKSKKKEESPKDAGTKDNGDAKADAAKQDK